LQDFEPIEKLHQGGVALSHMHGLIGVREFKHFPKPASTAVRQAAGAEKASMFGSYRAIGEKHPFAGLHRKLFSMILFMVCILKIIKDELVIPTYITHVIAHVL
jgi:hypothetical protein